MEELIGLLLILVFGGIEAWNKHKKKKAEAGGKGNVGSKKKLSGRERRRERMPEAWPAVDMGGADHRPAPWRCLLLRMKAGGLSSIRSLHPKERGWKNIHRNPMGLVSRNPKGP